MGDFGIPLLIIGMLVIFAVDVFSVSYLKTALLDMRMRKPGFFLGSAGICIASIVLSLIMAGAFLQSPATAEVATATMTATTASIEAKPDVKTDSNKKSDAKTEPKSEQNETEKTEQQKPEQKESEQPAQLPAAPTASVVQSTVPTLSVWQGHYKGFDYSFIEVENGTPYVYMPDNRGDFQSDLNNIMNNREGGNIIVMANAGTFKDDTSPQGTTIQNKNIMTVGDAAKLPRTLVVDEFGNVGYTAEKIENGVASYIDAKTGETVKNRRIVSAVYAFTPIMMNKKAVNKTSVENYETYRARQIFCVKQNSYVIITNTGELENGGWNFDDMVQVATYRGCLSAFNLDGGGSTATAFRTTLSKNFTILATTKRRDPTFIVFTADNLAPRGK